MRRHPNDEQERVSHETIYRSLYVQTRGVLKKELPQCLRSPRAIRRSRHATQKGLKLRKIKDAVPIRECPPEIKDRAVPGHREGDLIVGANNSYIATLVDRHSRFVMLAKVANKDTQSVITALIKQARKLPKELYRSLTWDRGSELTGHVHFTMVTKINVYFCDPQSPWQRDSNENTNRLLRQYFPRGLDISKYSQAKLSAVAPQLNERPRKTCNTKHRQRSSLSVLRRSLESASAKRTESASTLLRTKAVPALVRWVGFLSILRRCAADRPL